ncbi:MAG: hydrogenase expression/formation protein HypE [Thermoplasmata archaeon]|jgi:hydrogenase expression/formation protein HypE
MKIEMKHGAGGSYMDKLLRDEIISILSSDSDVEVPLSYMDDSSVIDGIAFTTDSYTVRPYFFPGGDIGKLSVSGTVNDLSVIGAVPVALSSGIVLREGFDMDDLRRIIRSMRETLDYAGTRIITGDFKVMEHDKMDGIIINTSGIGKRSPYLERNFEIVNSYSPREGRWLLDRNLRDGDILIVTGYIGDHGVSVLSSREGISFETDVKSDVQPLNRMFEEALKVGGIVSAKDPTRGGLANALNEMAEKSQVGMIIEEERIPVREGVRSACEMLGIDPYEIGNEGKAIIGVVPEMADDVLKALRRTSEGMNSEIIGRVVKDLEYVILETSVGGRRIMERPIGDPVPRIC